MIFGRSDLPLKNDSMGRFLPWLIAVMVFLAVLATCGAFILNTLSERWNKDLSATLTIEIAPELNSAGDMKQIDKELVNAVLAEIRSRGGTLSASVVSPERVMTLLEPWLGSSVTASFLPLPTLIDVTIDLTKSFDIEDLSRRLSSLSADISVDDHRLWLNRLLQLFQAIEALAALIVFLIVTATVITVVFVTRAGLAVHQEAIEVLHLIGAPDKYIAHQFAMRALSLGLQGGLLGMCLTVPAIFSASVVLSELPSDLVPSVQLKFWNWLVIGGTPLAMALLAMTTARITVIRILARMI